MYTLVIQFPFQSVNDEQYMLTLYASRGGAFANAINAMTADTRCFTLVSQVDATTTFEGTLTGNVVAADDDRDDVFTPLVSSKLKFNMACQTFPSWLMDICDYYTNVKVVLYATQNGTKYERWRGYLMANTLNMTVVDEMMSCPLVAVDEIGIAKYLKFTENFPYNASYLTVLGVLQDYWRLNHDENFADLYTILGLSANGTIYVERDIRYTNDSGVDEVNVIGNLTVNLERYFLDRDATWSDVLSDVLAYLGVTLCVGSVGPTGNDRYILSDTDYSFGQYLAYSAYSDAYSIASSRPFADFTNQTKIGADLQITYTPEEWKGVDVQSSPERPPVHDYLAHDNVQPIAPASGHDEWCETRIGKYNSDTVIDDYKYRVFQYTEIVDKEDQWISEAEYVDMEDCEVATAARTVGIRDGYFPLTDSALGRNRPDGNDTDSLDFALSKIGMITARVGTYETIRQKISADLKDYFVILNNLWGRKYWDNDAIVNDPLEQTPELIATFSPFANDGSVRPANKSYLTIDFSAMFLNENIGGNIRATNQSVTPNTLVDDFEGLIQAVFPITDDYHGWGSDYDDWIFSGSLVADENNVVTSYFPFLYARLRIGNYFWTGEYWQHYDDLSDGPWFQLPVIPSESTDKYWMVSNGYMHGNVNNYYYVECRPRVGASDNLFRVPLEGLSSHANPLDGKVELEIGGRIPPFNGRRIHGTTHYNNILFALLSDIRIEYSDEASMAGDDIDVSEKTITDSTSTTKKIKEVKLNLSTPKVDGVFSNCLLYDGGKAWYNLQAIHKNGGTDETPEKRISTEMAAVFDGPQMFVEFSRPFAAMLTDNIYNVGFVVTNMTECSGHYMPLTREFNFVKGNVRWKLQRV